MRGGVAATMTTVTTPMTAVTATAAALLFCIRGCSERDDNHGRYGYNANTGLAHDNFFP
jgi:hypothetical protein